MATVFLDAQEVEAILSLEIRKMYSEKNTEDDPNEMREEFHRMREHIYKEADVNRDGLISKKEFLEFTRRMEFQRDDGWKVWTKRRSTRRTSSDAITAPTGRSTPTVRRVSASTYRNTSLRSTRIRAIPPTPPDYQQYQQYGQPNPGLHPNDQYFQQQHSRRSITPNSNSMDSRGDIPSNTPNSRWDIPRNINNNHNTTQQYQQIGTTNATPTSPANRGCLPNTTRRLFHHNLRLNCRLNNSISRTNKTRSKYRPQVNNKGGSSTTTPATPTTLNLM